MTLFDQILTLIACPFFFVIQCITVDDVFSNHLISCVDVLSKHIIVGRGVSLIDTPPWDDLISSKVISGGGDYLINTPYERWIKIEIDKWIAKNIFHSERQWRISDAATLMYTRSFALLRMTLHWKNFRKPILFDYNVISTYLIRTSRSG